MKKDTPLHWWRSRHFWLAIFWACMAIPTIGWWKTSILWVAIMSVYAIVGAHLAGHGAKRAELAGLTKQEADEVVEAARLIKQHFS